MSAQPAALPRYSSSPGIPNESTTLEQIQVKLVEALHEMQKETESPVRNLADSIRFVRKALTLVEVDDPGVLRDIDTPADLAAYLDRDEP